MRYRVATAADVDANGFVEVGALAGLNPDGLDEIFYRLDLT